MKTPIRVFAVGKAHGGAVPLSGKACEAVLDRTELRELVQKCLGYIGPSELGEHDHWDWYLHPLPRRHRHLLWSDCHDPEDVMVGVWALSFEVATRRRGTVWDPLLACARDAASGELLGCFWQFGLTAGQEKVFMNARTKEVLTFQGDTVIQRHRYQDGETTEGLWFDGRKAVLSIEALPHPCDKPEQLLGALTAVCRKAKMSGGRVASQRGGAA
jgi:hypothetical protein